MNPQSRVSFMSGGDRTNDDDVGGCDNQYYYMWRNDGIQRGV